MLTFVALLAAVTIPNVEFVINPPATRVPTTSLEFRIVLRDGGTGAARPYHDFGQLDTQQLASRKSGPVAFRLPGDAGTFDCRGTAGERRGKGTCTFTLNRDYTATLARLGIEKPSPEMQMRMAVHDIRLDFIRRMKARGVRDLSIRNLINLRMAGER